MPHRRQLARELLRDAALNSGAFDAAAVSIYRMSAYADDDSEFPACDIFDGETQLVEELKEIDASCINWPSEFEIVVELRAVGDSGELCAAALDDLELAFDGEFETMFNADAFAAIAFDITRATSEKVLAEPEGSTVIGLQTLVYTFRHE